jgi:hypothetical protein
VSKSVLAMPSLYFSVEISRSSRIETYKLRDLPDVYNGLELMC